MTQTQGRVFGIFLFLALAISVAAFAAKPLTGAPAIGDPNISASAIQWQTSGAYERLILTVSGPEDYSLSKEVEAGRAATLRVQELGAKVPFDGQYTWELRVVPHVSAETKQQLAAAREAGDDRAVTRIQTEAGLNRDIVRSGTFTIQGGSFVISEDEERVTPGARKVAANALKPVPQDVVTADDEIIQGSLCVGLDCVNNESFGFDTIRLKENNLRIRFDDTSTAAGFPANDWQLTANDSASGGASKFSIDDTTNNKTPFTILASAPTNSMFVASSGKVGFRTATPVLDLHITTGDTPAIRQEQTSASGFTAQTWDIGANEANWFVRDVTGGSRLPLRIRPGATTSSIDISSDGDVGINTASPNANAKVDIFDSTQAKARIVLSGQEFFQAGNTSTDGIALLVGVNRTGNRQIWFGDSANLAASPTNTTIRISPNAGEVAAIATDGSAKPLTINLNGGSVGIGIVPAFPIHHVSGARLEGGNWTNASSRSVKQDIKDLDSPEAFAALAALNPVTYEYKTNPSDKQVGFIAEDVPDLVATPDRKGLSAMDIVAVLTKVVKEQQKVIDQLSQRVEQLEKDGQKSQK